MTLSAVNHLKIDVYPNLRMRLGALYFRGIAASPKDGRQARCETFGAPSEIFFDLGE